MKNDRWLLVVLVLASIVIGLTLIVLRCSSGVEPEVIIQTDTLVVTKTDTIHKIVTEDHIIYRDKIIYRDIPINVDTAEILKDYFATRYYERDIIEDNFEATIFDSISQNRITWSQFEYEVYVDTVFVNIETEITKTLYRSGFYANFIGSTKWVGVGISHQWKNGAMYGINPYVTVDKDFGISIFMSLPLNQR